MLAQGAGNATSGAGGQDTAWQVLPAVHARLLRPGDGRRNRARDPAHLAAHRAALPQDAQARHRCPVVPLPGRPAGAFFANLFLSLLPVPILTTVLGPGCYASPTVLSEVTSGCNYMSAWRGHALNASEASFLVTRRGRPWRMR